MTIPYQPVRTRLRDKRAARSGTSHAQSMILWNARFARATTPPDRMTVTYYLLRTRMTQALKRADAKIIRTPSGPRRRQAEAKASALRARITTDIAKLIKHMQSIADRYDRPRTPTDRRASDAYWISQIQAAADGSPMDMFRTIKEFLRARTTACWATADESLRATMAGELAELTAQMRELADDYYKPRV